MQWEIASILLLACVYMYICMCVNTSTNIFWPKNNVPGIKNIAIYNTWLWAELQRQKKSLGLFFCGHYHSEGSLLWNLTVNQVITSYLVLRLVTLQICAWRISRTKLRLWWWGSESYVHPWGVLDYFNANFSVPKNSKN